MGAWTSRADDTGAARHRELHRGSSDAAGSPVDEHDAACPDAELVK
jgi:hypothetical protein